ncbi:hypothetical protein CANARDRAFT_197521 [[Candida] arabinofermentans NRRL YB-2248]|uniref:Uncharacterized protein n=1 Tax=[Candida] arabinofermentans NRRL YB-2248 TaxID=983967 RepID=A0A1E4T228_9ASCO|nr:hypothetical protein CANARDRAFT_197521 [[Candida] arabinofermentans NRRL YB-2248]
MSNDLEKQLTDEHIDSSSNTNPHGIYDDSATKIVTSDDGAYVYFGNQKFARHELMTAFGGTLNPGLAPPTVHKFGNPAPLGLSAFALTTFVLSLINAGAMGVSKNNVVIGLALFYGGLIQLLAGMWEMAVENTFGALALSSYGGFWMSFGVLSIPWFGIESSYTDVTELENAIGFYLLGWTIFTFILCICTMKSTVMFFSLFVCLDITFLMLTLGKLAKSPNCDTAGGVFGVITAFIAWYNACAGVFNENNSYITFSGIPLPVIGKKRV